MASRLLTYHKNVGMNASVIGATVDCRNAQRVSFQNHYSSATPSGDFSYEISNDPRAVSDPANAKWTAVTPTTTYGAQPNASAAGTFAVVFVDLFRYIRQKWTRVAGGAGDLLNTWVDLDNGGM